jgi:hypothetical protein
LLAVNARAKAPEEKNRMEDVPLSPAAKITIERRGQMVLIGINRPYIHNRTDPDASFGLAKVYYDYNHCARRSRGLRVHMGDATIEAGLDLLVGHFEFFWLLRASMQVLDWHGGLNDEAVAPLLTQCDRLTQLSRKRKFHGQSSEFTRRSCNRARALLSSLIIAVRHCGLTCLIFAVMQFVIPSTLRRYRPQRRRASGVQASRVASSTSCAMPTR